MKPRYTLPVLSLGMLCAAGQLHASEPANVRITNTSGDKLFFQPESLLGYNRIYATDTVMSVSELPAYYRLATADGSYYPVFLTPGSETVISVGADGVDIKGTNERENKFMNTHSYICRTPESIKPYSSEWIDYNEAEIATLDSIIDAEGLNPEFAAIHKLYNRFTFLNQRLNGVTFAQTFRPGGKKVELSNNFYDFLSSLRFTDERILTIPKWFTVINGALETMEKHGVIDVDNDNYMSIYARAIDNEKVRSHYLIELLNLTLKRNYLNDIERQLPTIRQYITDSAALAQLPAIEAKLAEQKEATANTAAGTPMPEFTCKTVDGKEYNLSDFRGDYVIVDFWFTGCVPCRAEMPYFDKVATDFDGRGVKFVSLSLDTGDELYATWEKMMQEKAHTPGVISVNLPDGFNSPLLGKLNIHGVPRIMLLDREGKIVESYAKRPSDPKLRQQLENLISR